ncbi:hypothetical protein ACMFMG_002391 [Clarireedia jacksonii]
MSPNIRSTSQTLTIPSSITPQHSHPSSSSSSSTTIPTARFLSHLSHPQQQQEPAPRTHTLSDHFQNMLDFTSTLLAAFIACVLAIMLIYWCGIYILRRVLGIRSEERVGVWGRSVRDEREREGERKKVGFVELEQEQEQEQRDAGVRDDGERERERKGRAGKAKAKASGYDGGSGKGARKLEGGARPGVKDVESLHAGTVVSGVL